MKGAVWLRLTQHIGAMKARIQLPQHIEIPMPLPGSQNISHLDCDQCHVASVSLQDS